MDVEKDEAGTCSFSEWYTVPLFKAEESHYFVISYLSEDGMYVYKH